MHISPEELVVFYHAVRANDDDRIKQLTHDFIKKYGKEVLSTRSPNPYSNYFFRMENRRWTVVGLCVEDTQATRTVAKDLDVSDCIYFGANGDPVEDLTVEQIATLMPNIKQWYEDGQKKKKQNNPKKKIVKKKVEKNLEPDKRTYITFKTPHLRHNLQ